MALPYGPPGFEQGSSVESGLQAFTRSRTRTPVEIALLRVAITYRYHTRRGSATRTRSSYEPCRNPYQFKYGIWDLYFGLVRIDY
eukprot:scaffold429293_cov28-Prasinocladus_malaysianus.AAC.1